MKEIINEINSSIEKLKKCQATEVRKEAYVKLIEVSDILTTEYLQEKANELDTTGNEI